MPEKVEIRAGLTVERKSIRDIEYVSEGYKPAQIMTTVELRDFEAKYLKKHLDDKGQLTPAAEIAFLVSCGLIDVVIHNHPYQTSSDATLYVKTQWAEKYTRMVEVLDQWKDHQGRISYAKAKALVDMEKEQNEGHPLTKINQKK